MYVFLSQQQWKKKTEREKWLSDFLIYAAHFLLNFVLTRVLPLENRKVVSFCRRRLVIKVVFGRARDNLIQIHLPTPSFIPFFSLVWRDTHVEWRRQLEHPIKCHQRREKKRKAEHERVQSEEWEMSSLCRFTLISWKSCYSSLVRHFGPDAKSLFYGVS